jgi:hypothetical protein
MLKKSQNFNLLYVHRHQWLNFNEKLFMRHFFYFLIIALLSVNANAQGTPPTITSTPEAAGEPPTVVVPVDPEGKQKVKFEAHGTDADLPPPQPPYHVVGPLKYIWSYDTFTGKPAPLVESTSNALEIERKVPGKTVVKAKLTKDTEDETKDSGPPTQTGFTIKPITLYIIKVDPKEVSFSGTKFHVVEEDDFPKKYDAPHWQDNSSPLDGDADDPGERTYPVCFTRNSKMKISVKFELTPEPPKTTKFKIRGDGPDNLDFDATEATLSGNKLSISDIECKNAFQNKIDFLNPMEIKWEVSTDNGDTWCKAGSTKNRVYIILEEPAAYSLYETLLDIGCRNAKGKVDPGTATTAIWNDFLTPIPGVKRKTIDGHNVPDGTEMKFWMEFPNPLLNRTGQTLEAIINPAPTTNINGAGSCTAWSQLFHWTLRAQGISNSEIVVITPQDPHVKDFLIKIWNFGMHIRTGPNGICNSNASGDDVGLVKKGEGFPNAACIKIKGSFDSALGGDDQLAGSEVNTGANGICETQANGNDVQLIPVGQGEPDQPCIMPGPNGTLDSTFTMDDTTQDGLMAKIDKDFPYVVFTIESGRGISTGDAANQAGISGQGVNEPPPTFQNHLVVKIGNQVYDPSYGRGPFPDEEAHENAACDGLMKTVAGQLVAGKNDPKKKDLKYKAP